MSSNYEYDTLALVPELLRLSGTQMLKTLDWEVITAAFVKRMIEKGSFSYKVKQTNITERSYWTGGAKSELLVSRSGCIRAVMEPFIVDHLDHHVHKSMEAVDYIGLVTEFCIMHSEEDLTLHVDVLWK